jgi:hypothetical protein
MLVLLVASDPSTWVMAMVMDRPIAGLALWI